MMTNPEAAQPQGNEITSLTSSETPAKDEGDAHHDADPMQVQPIDDDELPVHAAARTPSKDECPPDRKTPPPARHIPPPPSAQSTIRIRPAPSPSSLSPAAPTLAILADGSAPLPSAAPPLRRPRRKRLAEARPTEIELKETGPAPPLSPPSEFAARSAPFAEPVSGVSGARGADDPPAYSDSPQASPLDRASSSSSLPSSARSSGALCLSSAGAPKAKRPAGLKLSCRVVVVVMAIFGVAFLALLLPLVLVYPQLGALRSAQQAVVTQQQNACYIVNSENATLLHQMTSLLEDMTARLGGMELRMAALETGQQAANQTAELDAFLEEQLVVLTSSVVVQVNQAYLNYTLCNQTVSLVDLEAEMAALTHETRINVTLGVGSLFGAQQSVLAQIDQEMRDKLVAQLGGLQSVVGNQTDALLAAQNKTTARLARNMTGELAELEAHMQAASAATSANVTEGVRMLLSPHLLTIERESNATRDALELQLGGVQQGLVNQTIILDAQAATHNATLRRVQGDVATSVGDLNAHIAATSAGTRANVTAGIHALLARETRDIETEHNLTRAVLGAQLDAVHVVLVAQQAMVANSTAVISANLSSLEALLLNHHTQLNATLQHAAVNLTSIHALLAVQQDEFAAALAREGNMTRGNITAVQTLLSAQHDALVATIEHDAQQTQGNLTLVHTALTALAGQMNDSAQLNQTMARVLDATADLHTSVSDLQYQTDAKDPYRVLAWGSNAHKQIGPLPEPSLGMPTSLRSDSVVGILRTHRFASYSVGAKHTLAVTPQGDVFAWGQGSRGALGVGPDASAECAPQQVLLGGRRCLAVSAGATHSLFLLENGVVYAAGDALGCGASADVFTPRHVAELGTGVTQVTAGHWCSYVVKGGSVWSWGNNTHARLGWNSPNTSCPAPIPAVTGVTRVVAGEGFALALTETRCVIAWGRSKLGQTGLGVLDSYSPLVIPGLLNVTSLAAGRDHALALVEGAPAWQYTGWGSNAYKAVENRDPSSVAHPTAANVTLLPGDAIARVACGEASSYLITRSGKLLSWGATADGRLGRSFGGASASPVATEVPVNAADFDEISVHSRHAVVWKK